MKYLNADGTFTDSLIKSQVDFIKFNITFSKGAAFNHLEYGYEYFNIDDDESIKNTVSRIISSMSNCNLSIKDIDRSIEGTVIIHFNEIDDIITLES